MSENDQPFPRRKTKSSFLFSAVTGVLLITVTSLALPGCGGRQVSHTQPPPTQTFRATGEAFMEGRDTVSSRYGYLEQVVEITGQGHPAPHAVTEAQKSLTAIQAARYAALANLVENVRGLQIERVAEVRDLVFASEHIQMKSKGEVSGVRVVDENYDEESEVATVKISVGLNSAGDIVPERLMPIVPLSQTTRRAQTENAARVRAAAALREEIGQVQLAQRVKVRNLVMTRHEAFAIVEGWLEGIQYSQPKWTKDKCVVEASITVTSEQLARLQRMITPE